MVGAHLSPNVRYPVSELAARFGASVEQGDIRPRRGICDRGAIPARTAAVLVRLALGFEPFNVALG